MEIKKAVPEQLERIMEIYASARVFMASQGNPSQWGSQNPSREQIEEDMAAGNCYVCTEQDESQTTEKERILAVFYYAFAEDPAYQKIAGCWLNDQPYGVVHRIAATREKKGTASFCLKWALEQCGNIRMDTHEDNIPMQRLLRKLGFLYCGRVTFADGSSRIAFQCCPVKQKSSLTTLIYLEKDGKYLMMHRVKKKQDVNQDKWVGVGGHFEQGESPEDCAIREVREETGYQLTSYKLRGVISFFCDHYPEEYMFLYTADGFFQDVDTLPDCDEGTLEWVPKEKVLELPIWEGDKIFLKLMQENHPFFSLKLRYEGEELVEAVLDGEILETTK